MDGTEVETFDPHEYIAAKRAAKLEEAKRRDNARYLKMQRKRYQEYLELKKEFGE